MRGLSYKEQVFLNDKLGMKLCKVENGCATNPITGEIIDTDTIMYQTLPKDGLYEIGEMTCGGALPTGFNEETLESNPEIENPTEKDKEKYQCRVSRRAPKCDMYSKAKCAVYSLTPLGKYTMHISLDKLLDVVNIE